jgi:hypothetical protein
VMYGYEMWSMTEMDKVMLIAHVQTSNWKRGLGNENQPRTKGIIKHLWSGKRY